MYTWDCGTVDCATARAVAVATFATVCPRTRSDIIDCLVTVARDRHSDSEDCYVLVVLFIFYLVFSVHRFFRRPWADFRETLPYDAVFPEIVYLL